MSTQPWCSGVWFQLIYRHHLIYNACWEDPRVDRVALDLGADDVILVITSAGCNVLDYALLEPQQIYAVDMNFRQNALLELKLAGIQALDFAQFFAMFGHGRLENYQELYQRQLRPRLSPVAQLYWDRHITYFSGRGWQRTFYFHGTAGVFARLVNAYMDQIARVRAYIEALLDADSLDEQHDIYDRCLRDAVWNRFIRWLVRQDMVLSLLGVPPAQRQQVERHYHGGIVQFMEDCVEAVFTRLPLRENYFWRLYMRGEYTPDCCPEYLKPANFARLKTSLATRISVHTSTILDFLRTHQAGISRFVLLDHMDWLSTVQHPVLQQEWQAMVGSARPGARFLWRSGGCRVDYVDPITVFLRGRSHRLGDLLTYHQDLAAALHAQDRVHTYGSFYIADLAVA